MAVMAERVVQADRVAQASIPLVVSPPKGHTIKELFQIIIGAMDKTVALIPESICIGTVLSLPVVAASTILEAHRWRRTATLLFRLRLHTIKSPAQLTLLRTTSPQVELVALAVVPVAVVLDKVTTHHGQPVAVDSLAVVDSLAELTLVLADKVAQVAMEATAETGVNPVALVQQEIRVPQETLVTMAADLQDLAELPEAVVQVQDVIWLRELQTSH
jgi:hypothetical protein